MTIMLSSLGPVNSLGYRSVIIILLSVGPVNSLGYRSVTIILSTVGPVNSLDSICHLDSFFLVFFIYLFFLFMDFLKMCHLHSLFQLISDNNITTHTFMARGSRLFFVRGPVQSETELIFHVVTSIHIKIKQLIMELFLSPLFLNPCLNSVFAFFFTGLSFFIFQHLWGRGCNT